MTKSKQFPVSQSGQCTIQSLATKVGSLCLTSVVTGDPWEQKNLIDDPRYDSDSKKLAEQMRSYGQATQDPRFTGELDFFIQTRYVQMRKKMGYEKTLKLPFDKAAFQSR